MHFRVRAQLREALCEVNRYYCAKTQGRFVEDPEVLLRHYIENGGAKDFALRYAAAMSQENRYYASQYYRMEINDPEILWNYYHANRK